MKVSELYSVFDSIIPKSLSCEWDNDGLMCSPDKEKEVKRVLLSLDCTKATVEYAIKYNFDLIITHHPLIFNKLGEMSGNSGASMKVIDLIRNGVSVFSFHTRADAYRDGVNERLAKILCLKDVHPLFDGENNMGRIGTVNSTDLDSFACFVKDRLSSPFVLYSGNKTVNKVALVGGDGKDFADFAKMQGADTFVSGRISYNITVEAKEKGINLIEAGHYYTEKHITKLFEDIIKQNTKDIYCEILDFCEIKAI